MTPMSHSSIRLKTDKALISRNNEVYIIKKIFNHETQINTNQRSPLTLSDNYETRNRFSSLYLDSKRRIDQKRKIELGIYDDECTFHPYLYKKMTQINNINKSFNNQPFQNITNSENPEKQKST